MTIIVIGLVILALLAIGVAVVTQRVASQHRFGSHSDVDAETKAYEQHPPGGNTGGI